MIYSSVSDFDRKQTPIKPIEIRISDADKRVRFGQERELLAEKLIQLGYRCFDGTVNREYSLHSFEIVFLYTPSRRDILFKRFERPKSPRDKTRKILFRRFK